MPLARADEAHQLVPWLDLPASWAGTVTKGVVSLSPDDLSSFDSLVLRVEPLSNSRRTLDDDYAQALRDLGPWRPVGRPGAALRQRLGVPARGGGGDARGPDLHRETAVARRGDLQVRFWVLADSDATFNRYKAATSNAIASAQDITHPPARAAAPPAAPVQSARLDAGSARESRACTSASSAG